MDGSDRRFERHRSTSVLAQLPLGSLSFLPVFS